MDKQETNKMNSFLATEEVMVRNEAIWKTSPNATKVFGLIQVKLPSVSKYNQEQNPNVKPSTVLKKETKTDLVKMAIKISVSAVSYADGIEDTALEMEVSFQKTNLSKLKQVVLYNTLVKFYNTVKPLKASLTHLDAGDMDKLGSLLDEYKASIPKTEADNDSSKTATQNIDETMHELNALYKQLDKHIRPFEYTHADFYSDYMNSRKVKNLKGKSTKTKKAKKANGEVKAA